MTFNVLETERLQLRPLGHGAADLLEPGRGVALEVCFGDVAGAAHR